MTHMWKRQGRSAVENENIGPLKGQVVPAFDLFLHLRPLLEWMDSSEERESEAECRGSSES